MSRSPLDYLRHVLDETEYIARVVERLSRDVFLGDETACFFDGLQAVYTEDSLH